MEVRQIFADIASGREVALPVSPSTWQWSAGNDLKSVSAIGFGEINLAGDRTAASEVIRGFFPSKNYSFINSGGNIQTESYIAFFEDAVKNGTILRYIVSGTNINSPVLISSFIYGQEGASGDINYTITIKEARFPVITVSAVATASAERDPIIDSTTVSYTVISGDTLSALCKRFYGDGSMDLARRVASHNGIANANLIYVGDILEFPPIDGLTLNQSKISTADTISKNGSTTCRLTLRLSGLTYGIYSGLVSLNYIAPDGAKKTISTKSAVNTDGKVLEVRQNSEFKVSWVNNDDLYVSYCKIDGEKSWEAFALGVASHSLEIEVHFDKYSHLKKG